MRVLINAALLPDTYSCEYVSVLYKTIKDIAGNEKKSKFIFICEMQDAKLLDEQINIEFIKIKKRKRTAIRWKYWYDVRIPALLRKHKADLFISPGSFCSLTTKVPQLIVLADASFSNLPSLFRKSQFSFLKKREAKSVAKAKCIITSTQSEKNRITEKFNLAVDKIFAVPVIIPERIIAVDEINSEEIKLKYTAGKEFFLYDGPLNANGNIINLLKAFSLFKKRQQSSFKLVILSNKPCEKTEYPKLLDSYKYKADVVFINQSTQDERNKLLASAYALVFPVFLNNFLFPVLQAMQNGIPVITSAYPAFKEITGNASLHVDAENPQDIADSMMRIYKDEKGRSELIEKGKSVIDFHIKKNAPEEFFKVMQMAVLQNS